MIRNSNQKWEIGQTVKVGFMSCREQRRLSMLDVIAPNRSHYGMSDDQLSNEYAAQRFLARAIRRMHFAIAMVNHNSVVVSIDPKAFEAFVHDDLPSETFWCAAIDQARYP